MLIFDNRLGKRLLHIKSTFYFSDRRDTDFTNKIKDFGKLSNGLSEWVVFLKLKSNYLIFLVNLILKRLPLFSGKWLNFFV